MYFALNSNNAQKMARGYHYEQTFGTTTEHYLTFKLLTGVVCLSQIFKIYLNYSTIQHPGPVEII